MKKSTLITLLLILMGSVYAQRGFDRSEMVAREKEMVLTKVEDLNADQKLLLEGIYEEYGVTMNETIDEIRESRDYSQFRTKIPALQKEKDLLIKDVLNKEQYAAYEKVINGGGLGFGGGRRQNDNDPEPAESAQPEQTSETAETRPARPAGFDVSAMVAREKEKVMTEVADLSDEQKNSLEGIYNEFEKSLKETSDEVTKSGDFSQLREKMPAIRSQKDMKIKEVLSAEQFATYEEIIKNNGPGSGRGRRPVGDNSGSGRSGVEQ